MQDFRDEDDSVKEGRSVPGRLLFEHVAEDCHSAVQTRRSQPLDAFLCFDVGSRWMFVSRDTMIDLGCDNYRLRRPALPTNR